jgi:succinyl-CoA synthetase alpha subunit
MKAGLIAGLLALTVLASGAQVVGGVNARKAGTKVDFDGTVLPVFGSVSEAMARIDSICCQSA